MNSRKIVLLTIENSIAKIELNSPENNNALSPAMIEALTAVFDACERNDDAHIILLYTKHKNFCSGADLSHMVSLFNKTYEDNLLDAKQFVGIFLRIYNCKKPVICCVCGNITAGALGLMSVCDINITNQDAIFRFPEVALSGVPYSISPFVVKRIGDTNATRLMLTAESFNAKEAKKVGLINYVAPNSFEKGLSLAIEMQKNNLEAMTKTKQWLRAISPMDKKILDESAQKLAAMRMDPKTKMAVEDHIKSKL